MDFEYKPERTVALEQKAAIQSIRQLGQMNVPDIVLITVSLL